MSLITITEEIELLFDKYWRDAGDGREYVLTNLKNLGYSQIDTIKILIEMEGLSLQMANEMVSRSSAWNS